MWQSWHTDRPSEVGAALGVRNSVTGRRTLTPAQLADVRAYLERSGIARQKWPEHLRSVDEFPRTPSGKVQKFVLRQQLRDA